MDLKKFEKALQQYHQHKYADAHKVFTKLLESADNAAFGEKCRAYAEACRLHMKEEQDTDPFAHAVFLSNSGKHEEAARILSELVKKDGGNDALLFTLSCLYAAMGEVNKAVDTLRKAIKLNPENRVHALNHRDFHEMKDTITAL